jgi:hypothetical protein
MIYVSVKQQVKSFFGKNFRFRAEAEQQNRFWENSKSC